MVLTYIIQHQKHSRKVWPFIGADSLLLQATFMKQPDLISQQRSLLQKIYSQGQNLWKVAIFDAPNRDINSGIFRVKDLRQNNVTLYLHLREAREALHGVTAIYLVEPSPENINLIYNDFEDDLYSSVVIHFSSQPKSNIISGLAKKLAKNKPGALSKIQKIEYSHLGFFPVARNMAVLPDTSQLVNLISILKNKPIFIMSSKEEERVSFLKQRLLMGNIFSKEQELITLKQPYNLVFFLNRETDLFPVLHHSITYAGLLQSVYKVSANGRSILREGEKSLQIDLNDQIWTQRRNLSTSELCLQQQLNVIRAKKMNQKDKLADLNDYNQRQKKIQLHTEIVFDLIKKASARKLNEFHQLEMEIYKKRVLTGQIKKEIMILLETTEHTLDKVRLILIVLLYCDHISPQEIQEFQQKVPSLNKSKLYTETKNKILKDSTDDQKGLVGGAGKMFKKFSTGLLSNFKSGDKFLSTKCVERISSLKENDLREMGLSMTSFDPIPVDAKVGSIVVFCIGGGCLAEEANLAKHDNRVIYCCDRMLGAEEVIGLK